MEFPDVGQCCDELYCKQLNFLPLKCKCGKIFCPDHYSNHVENCHTTESNFVTKLNRITDVHKCSFPNCKTTSILAIVCDRCKQNFCIEHRHTVQCTKDPAPAEEFRMKNEEVKRLYENAKSSINKEIDGNIAKAKLKGKNSATAQKVQLMRLKNKAVGLKSIPSVDRVYFSIVYPKSFGDKNGAVFVSKSWSIGRVIDSISDELNILNQNNLSNTLKLRLFKSTDGSIISTVMAQKIDDIIKNNIIADGENLIMEYVSDTCINVDEF